MSKVKRRAIGIILLVIGIMMVVSSVIMRMEGEQRQKNILKNFNKQLQEVDENLNQNFNADDDSPTSKEASQVTGTIGKIEIPKISLEVALSEGIEEEVLKYAVGHFPGTAMPGQKGNFCVAGHRSYTYNEFFNRLDALDLGDEIIVKTLKGNFTYVVYDIRIVEPEEVSVLDKTEDAEITLVTCTPIRIATHRLIVKGKLKEKKF